MYCPFCGAHDSRVIDSRLASDGHQVRRRRECVECAERFTTYEVVELSMPRIVKRDGSRSPYDENKLRGGMLRALEKRPVGTDKIEQAIQRIKHKLRVTGDRECNSKKLGSWVMEELHLLDKVAYVRFASVYWSFQDLNRFKQEIEVLMEPVEQSTKNIDKDIEIIE